MKNMFYVVERHKEDSFWTKWKRASCNSNSNEGFASRAAALEAVNKIARPGSSTEYRIVEILQQVVVERLELVKKLVWQ